MKHNWEKDENGNINEWAWENGFHNGVFCVDCGESVCVCCNPYYMELDDCTGPKESKAITNADRLNAMSDEEKAKELTMLFSRVSQKTNAEHYILEWLQLPAEEDT